MDQAEIRTLRVAGQEVRVALHGRADAARTLLVFNGIGASLETVAPFAAQFRDTRIVTFDVPGVGGSPTPALPYRFAWLARLAARLLDALGDRRGRRLRRLLGRRARPAVRPRLPRAVAGR